MKKKTLIGLLLCLACPLFAQTGNAPLFDTPIFQTFILNSNGVSATGTTNLVAGTNMWFQRGAETAEFWVKAQGDPSATTASSDTIIFSPISVQRTGTNTITTNVVTSTESRFVFTMSPNGSTAVIKSTNFSVNGIEGLVVTSVKNVSGGVLTNTVWVTYRQMPK